MVSLSRILPIRMQSGDDCHYTVGLATSPGLPSATCPTMRVPDTASPPALTVMIPTREADRELDAFLADHFNESMYLRAELLRTSDRSHFAIGREKGAIVAVAAQVASGMVLLQAPIGAAQVATAVLRNTGRRLAGFFGAASQVRTARNGMGLDTVAFAKDTAEDLFTLVLAELKLPGPLASGEVGCRVAAVEDIELLVRWRFAFRVEAMKDAPGEHLERMSRADIDALLPAGNLFILETGEPVACCSFNARLPDAVNVGNVWTPPELRGRGYARAVVAGALRIAESQGVKSAVLATGQYNKAAQAAYRSIGFKVVGDYATATIAPDTALPTF